MVLNMSGRGTLLTGVIVLVGLWIAVTTGFAAMFSGPLGVLAANPRIVIAVALAVLLAYWVLDETDADDDVTDALEKTSDRAAEASGGFITVTRFLIAGIATVVIMSGDALLDLLAQSPMVVGQIGIAGLGFAVVRGFADPRVLLAGALVIIIVSSIFAERTNA